MDQNIKSYINPVDQPQSEETLLSRLKKKFLKRKMILVAIGAIIALEVMGGVYYLTKSTPGTTPSTAGNIKTTPVPKEATAKVTLNGPNNLRMGDSFKVDMLLETDSPVDGADIILKYDPRLLKVEPVRASGKLVPIAVGSIFGDYPLNSYDPKTGVISFSGLTSITATGFSGKGELGSISFKTLGQGDTAISVEFAKGSTTDSNVIEGGTGKDILALVYNLSVNIEK